MVVPPRPTGEAGDLPASGPGDIRQTTPVGRRQSGADRVKGHPEDDDEHRDHESECEDRIHSPPPL